MGRETANSTGAGPGLARGPARRRVVRWLLPIAAVVLAAAAYLAGPGERLDAWALGQAREGLVKTLLRPVSISSVHVSPFLGRVEIRDLAVGAMPPSTKSVLSIPRVTASVSLLPLLRGRLEIRSVRVDRPAAAFWRESGRWEGPIPAALEEQAGMEIDLKRLEVIDGVLSVEDRSIPIWCRAEGARVAWTSRPGGDGSGTFDSQKLSGGTPAASRSGKVHVEGALDGGAARASGSVSWGDNLLRFEASADVPAPRAVPTSGQVRASLDVAEAAEMPVVSSLLGFESPLSGRLRGNGLLRFDPNGWTAEGRVRGDRIHREGLEASELEVDFAATPRGLKIRSLVAKALGGTVKAEATVAPGEGGGIRAKFTADGLSLAEVLKAGGLETRLDGIGSLEGELTARMRDPDSLRGAGTFRVVPTGTASARGLLDAEASGEFALEGLAVTANASAARVGATTASLVAEKKLDRPSVALRAEIDSESLSESAALLDAILPHAPGESVLPLDPVALSGHGKASVDLAIEKDRPVSGTIVFSLEDVAYAGIGADTLDGRLVAEGGAFALRDTVARKEGGTFAVEEARFREGPGGLWHLRGTLDRWPADDILALAGAPGSPSARLGGRLEIAGSAAGRSGKAELSLSEAKFGPIAFETGRADATLEDSVFEIEHLSLRGPSGDANASGRFDIENKIFSGSVDASNADASLAGPWLRGLPVAGRVALSLRGESRGGVVAWSGTLAPAPEVSLRGRTLEGFSVAAEGDGARARVKARLGPGAGAEGEIAFAAPYPSSGHADLEGVPVAWLLGFTYPVAAASVGGELAGRIEWSGPLGDAGVLEAQAELHPVRILVGAESFTAPRPARISLARGQVSFDDVTLVSGANRVSLGGSYTLAPSRAALDLWLDGTADLSALTAFVPGLSSAGTLSIALRATGNPETPDLMGTARLQGGRVRMAGNSLLAADRLQAEATIEPGAVRIERITGTAAGGALTGTGHVGVEGLTPTSLLLEGKVTGATLELPKGFRGVYSGDLRFEAARGRVPALFGRIDLLRGVWRSAFQLDRVNLLARTRAPLADVPRPDEGMEKTTLDVTIEANDNLWLRNDLADTEARGRIKVGGTVGHPRFEGHFETIEGGELRFGEVRYDLESARVSIPAGPRINPEFDIVASTRVREYDIRMHLWGDTNRVESELSSNPSIPEREILSLLLTGTRMEDPNAPTRTGTIQDSAATLVGGQLRSLVGSQLERWLGFEEVRIEPYQYQTTGDPTTRVTLGKRLSPRVFVRTSVPLNSAETTGYEVEYQLNRKVKLSAFRGEHDALGGQARYSARTWSPHARKQRREAAGAAPVAGEKVGEVRFVGNPVEDPARLARIVPLRQGGSFSRRDLVEGTLKLKKHYVKNGYLEASVIASTTRPRDGFVDVEYAIERGDEVELVIEGAGDSAKAIRQLLDVLWLEPAASGTDVEEEAPERIRTALRDEGYFNADAKVAVEQGPSKRKVMVRVDRGEKVRVASLSIVGAAAIPESEIRTHVLVGRETRFRRDVLKPDVLEADVAAVESLYRSRGFLAADATWRVSLSPDGRDANVEITVTEGPRADVRSVAVRGNRAMGDDRVRALVRSRVGEPFDAVKVYQDLASIRALYDSDGYLDARVDEDLRTDGEKVDLAYDIVEGERKVLRDVEIEGNLVTHSKVIRRLVPFSEGDALSREKVQKLQTDLSRTGLFSEVRLSWADAPGPAGGQTLKIAVREADDLILGTGVGYDTYNGPRVHAEVADANLRGTGWYSGLSVILGGKVQREQLTFRAPRLVRGWMPILSAGHLIEERDSFTQQGTGASAALERKTAEDLTHIVRYATSYSDVYDLKVSEDEIHASEPRLDLGKLRLANVGYSIARDRRDNPLNTKRGTYLSADLRWFSELLGSQQRFSMLFLQGSAASPLTASLTGISALKVGVASRLGSGIPLPLQVRYFAGGDSTFRGFPQDRLGYVETETTVDESGNEVIVDKGTLQHDTLIPLGGEAVIILNNELRRPVWGGASAILFWDSGSVFPAPGEIRLNRFRNAVGTGIRFDTPVGPVRVEYGWKLDPQKNESAGEFVFTIGQSF